ncbi:MAG: DUF481 domain-containing protein [gamma proteobacterium symbiont of Taylorina sp.]|nr:DUF481 domain-containing protein [gamma proteobacterium symbiont of Taylorina sp.]
MKLMFALLYILLLFALSISKADTLTMKDGSSLVGHVISQEKNILKFDTSFAGIINVKWEQVKTIDTEQPVTIMLVTDELVSTKHISNIEGEISQIKKAGEEWKTAFKSHNVSYINPEPWLLDQGFKISALFNVSLKSQRGNTVKEELDLDGEIRFRSLQDRYTFKGLLEHDTSGDKTTSDNWLFSSKYDSFFTKKQYYGAQLQFERDRFTDLDLRTSFGPHIGHQRYESDELNLSSDIGLFKVWEDNIIDTDYLALNWNINYDQYFFNETTQLYHNQQGLWDWEKSGKVTFISWTGFRFPLRDGIVASTELEWEYDSQPNESINKSDRTYRIKLGYQW